MGQYIKRMMKHLILLMFLASASANEDKTLGMSEANPASSCDEIYQSNPTSRGTIGQYWIVTDAKQNSLAVKKVRGQSEATNISDQKL